MNSPMDDSDEWEERHLIVELNGVFDCEKVKLAVAAGEFRVIDLDSNNPMIQIGGAGLFTSRWEQPIGTDLILLADAGTDQSTSTKVQVMGVADRRLIADKAAVTPR